MKHQHIGVHRDPAEQAFRDRRLGFLDLVLGIVLIALGRLAQILAEDVAGHFQGQVARGEKALIIDQAGVAAAG